MRYFPYPTVLSTALLLATGSTSVLEAGPATPRERSFRPVVPIKQNVRGGMDQMKSQTVRLTIPPPPLPESVPASTSATSASDAPGPVAPESAAMESALPPEPVPSDLPDPVSAAEPSDNDKTTGGSETKPETSVEESKPKKTGPTLSQLREEAHALAGKKLSYVFGADDPDTGGLDCSSTIQFLLKRIGIEDVPRTSYDQYYWLKRKKLLDDVYGKSASSKLLKKLSPGDLIFWGGTWKSGHRVSHVMLYMGYDPASDKHYVFGARSKSTTGLTGAGVDIFELDTERGRLVAHGKVPGLVYE
jgi:cell wall-associated NlpC family hydrolase